VKEYSCTNLHTYSREGALRPGSPPRMERYYSGSKCHERNVKTFLSMIATINRVIAGL
jgi:hypothetical protein